MSIDWQVTDYFAGDLVHFLWCIGDGPSANPNYPEVKKHWRQMLRPQVISDLDYLMDSQTASVSSSMLGTLFRYLPAESTQDMIALVDEPETMTDCLAQTNPKVRSYVSGYVRFIRQNRERLLLVLSTLEEHQYDAYWREEILPIVRQRCDETREALSAYSPERMRMAVQDFLGVDSIIQSETKPVYLTYFGYSLAYHLPDDSVVDTFKAGVALNIKQIVSTWLHELLHNFPIDEEIRGYCDRLSENCAFSRTRTILRHWGEGETEDLIVAAEKYLATKLGVVTSEEAFGHIARNYDGGQMLAGVLYDMMERESALGTYGEYLLGVFRNGFVDSKTIDTQYRSVLSQRLGEIKAEQTFARIDRAYEQLSTR